jgi:zinc and cadmium transporter
MHPILLSVLLGLTAAAANVFGGAIIVQKNWDRSYLKYFVALGAGFMLATAIIEIFPASLELRGKSAAFLVLAGYLIVHLFEHTVTPHFHFGEETHKDAFVHGHRGYSVLLGLIIDTFFDGIAIASGFIVSNWLGWVIFLAIFLHKIPEGFTIASVMLASGQSRRTAWGASMLLGASTLAGSSPWPFSAIKSVTACRSRQG